MKNNLIKLTLFFLISITVSCSTDVEINADYKEIPVVYCVLNPSLLPADDPDAGSDRLRWQYVKVNKAFLSDQSIAGTAQISDSLFFDDVKVYLTEYKNGNKTRTWTFDKTDDIPKDEGFFANDINTLYRQKIDFGNYDENTEYSIIIDIDNGKHYITEKARINLVHNVGITIPNSYVNHVEFGSYSKNYEYKYKPGDNSTKHKVDLKFNYLDVKDSDTIFKSITYTINEEVYQVVTESELARTFNVGEFWDFVGTNLKPVEEGYKRLVKMPNSVEFQITSVIDEYYIYTQVTRPSTGVVQYKPAYTNIEGGYGLFASRANSYNSYKLSRSSLDIIQNGIYTAHLGFASQWDLYYHPYFMD